MLLVTTITLDTAIDTRYNGLNEIYAVAIVMTILMSISVNHIYDEEGDDNIQTKGLFLSKQL